MPSYTWQCPAVKGLIGKAQEGHRHLLLPIRCKRWTCTYCARINLRALLSRIRRGRPTKLITLTAKPNAYETPESVYKRHRPAIRRLLQWIRRHHGPIEACCVTELHKSGYPHWHLVARTNFIPQNQLSAKWDELTGSKIVDIRAVKNPKIAAAYCAKYVTKSHSNVRPPWLKRVTQFTKYYATKLKWETPPGYDWKPTDTRYERCLEILSMYHWYTKETEQGLVIIPPIEEDSQTLFDLLGASPTVHKRPPPEPIPAPKTQE